MTANPATITISDRNRILSAKAAYATRRIPQDDMMAVVCGNLIPRAGDVVLARLERVGRQGGMELASGGYTALSTGDELLLCMGNADGPERRDSLDPGGPGDCALVAAGGIAAPIRGPEGDEATTLRTLGLVADGRGEVLNLERYALPRMKPPSPRQVVLAVCGTAANAGRTDTVVHLITGLVRAGFRVAAAKVTGAGTAGDVRAAMDAGAGPVLDVTDVGLASTCRVARERVERAALDLLGYLSESPTDVIVLELDDGLLQSETARLLESRRFTVALDGVMLAAGDAPSAAAGGKWLSERRLHVVGTGGRLTESPLTAGELESVSGAPVYDMKTLNDPLAAARLIKPFLARPVCVA